MKKFHAFLFCCFLVHGAMAQVVVSGASGGVNGSYTNLNAAVQALAIAGNIQTGNNILITIQGIITEVITAPTLQNQGWSTLTIKPTGGTGSTVTGNFSGTPIFELNGASNVTIDGLNSGGNTLTFENTNASAPATIRFNSDAKNNTITNCTIKGSENVTANSGVIFLADPNTTSGSGNDNITISNCIIRESSNGFPCFGIFSYQSSASYVLANYNSNISITNNQIINCVSLTSSSGPLRGAGIHCYTRGSTDWTITGNSIYYTASITTTGSSPENYGIRISGNNGGNFQITNNYIGGTAVNAGGTALTFTLTTFGNKFCGIDLATLNSGTATSVQNNTIKNILLNTASGQISAPFIFCGIDIQGGLVNVGTVTGNTIGSNTINGSITVNVNTSPGGIVTGIASQGNSGTLVPANSTLSNNQISGVTVANVSVGNVYVNLKGITIPGSSATNTATINNNIIGSTTLTNSLLNSTGNTSALNSLVVGIESNSASTVSATGNTISNLTYNQGGSFFQVIGINFISGIANSVTNNIIKNLTNANPNIQVNKTASVIGINDNTLSSGGENISQNTIATLSNTNINNFAVNVYGIFFAGTGTGHIIARNLIYDLSTAASSTSSVIDGLRITGGTETISNNMISVGNTVTKNPLISGIDLQGGTPTLYYNSVVVTGVATGTAVVTTCIRFQANTSGTIVKDNIFYNNRTSATPGNNVAMYFATATQQQTNTTSNYNDLYTTSNVTLVTVAATNYATLTAWQATGSDLNSVSVAPTFTNIANDLHLNDCTLVGSGTTVSITIDYDGTTRNSPPTVGADEPGSAASFVGASGGDWNTASNWSSASVPTTSTAVTISSGVTVTISSTAYANTVTISSGGTLVISGSATLHIDGNCSTGIFSNNGTFTTGLGTVSFDGPANTLRGKITGVATTFYAIDLNTGVDFLATSETIISNLQILPGGYVSTNAPTYGVASTLTYSTSGSYNVGTEWTAATDGTAGFGRPNNVTLSSTTLKMTTTDRAMAGDLTIKGANILVLNDTSGDFYIRGNWTNAGSFAPNKRAVFFTGTAVTGQIITNTASLTTETFDYIVDKNTSTVGIKLASGTKLIVTNNNGGNGLQFLAAGPLDLNGNTCTFGSLGFAGIYLTGGNRSITNSSATISPFIINDGNAVSRSDQSSLLVFGDKVRVELNGGFSFGPSLTTINYVLRINSTGLVNTEGPVYAVGSILQYYSGNSYNRGVEMSKTSGSGYPYDVQVSNGTTLNMGNNTISGTNYGISHNLTIDVGCTLDMNNANKFLLVSNDIIINGTLKLSGGIIKLNGNWTDLGTFTPANGTIYFTSSTQAQSLVKSGGETFDNLVVDKPGQTLTLSSVAYVAQALTLTNGIIDAIAYKLDITNSASTAIIGALTNPSDPAYYSAPRINGTLQRSMVVGSTYDFPVGDNSNYELAQLKFNIAAGLTDLTVKWNSAILGSLPNSTLCSINTTPIFDILNAGYWTMTPNGVLTNLDYNVSLYETGYSNAGFTERDSTWGVIKRASLNADWLGTDYGSVGTHDYSQSLKYASGSNKTIVAVRNSVPSFSDFGIGISLQNTPLPIELTAFNAVNVNDNALLTWNTESEYNSDYFSVERSLDGKNFNEIGKVKAAGYSIQPLDYSLIDYSIDKLGAGTIYYRLRLVDQDESFKYSPVRVVHADQVITTDVSVMPNPFSDQLTVQILTAYDHMASLQMTNVSGTILLERKVDLKQGINQVNLNHLENLQAGMYFIELISGNDFYVKKAVKEE
ncbi:MAG: T9SS type A sorting domain-containing protein [Chitinophagales bacterium]|nr:T9SS type A sorting domain-containing protein [Chitinophagales bacterium]